MSEEVPLNIKVLKDIDLKKKDHIVAMLIAKLEEQLWNRIYDEDETKDFSYNNGQLSALKWVLGLREEDDDLIDEWGRYYDQYDRDKIQRKEEGLDHKGEE
jgi:hypothetical protein